MIRNIAMSAFYTLLICIAYETETSKFWGYINFHEGSFVVACLIAIPASIFIACLLPLQRTTRGLILTLLQYFYFIPTITYISFNDVHIEYIVGFICSVLLIFISSSRKAKIISSPKVSGKNLLSGSTLLILIVLLIYAAFGGLTTFNLNFSEVYEARSQIKTNLPGIVGYLWSNVSNILLPASLILAVRYRNKTILIFLISCCVLMFGFSSHKSVLFTSVMVLGLLYLFNRIKSPATIGLLPIAALILCCLEIFAYNFLLDIQYPGFFNTLLTRRALLVPPMLDSVWIDIFSESEKYYWSSTRFGLGLVPQPYEVAAPFHVGFTAFGRPTMSANTGIIGSGYSNFGFFGILLYAALLGYIISLLNGLGRRIGHLTVTALSFNIVLKITTSTDITPAVLTHGLLTLFVVLLLFPKQEYKSNVKVAENKNDYPLHDRSSSSRSPDTV